MKKKLLISTLGLLLVVSLVAIGCPAPAPPPAPVPAPAPAPAPAPPPTPAPPKYPDRMIVIICPWGVGGGSDTVSRQIAARLPETLGVRVVVKNVPGADGMIGFTHAMAVEPDGYTLLQASRDTITANLARETYKLHEHFGALANLNYTSSQLYVYAEAPWKDAKELLEYVKQHPKEVNIAVAAIAGMDGIILGKLALQDNLLFKPVSYDKPGERFASVAGGHNPVMIEQIGDVRAFVEAGKIKPVLSLTPERDPTFPELPSLEDVGLTGYSLAEFAFFRGLLYPMGIPEERLVILGDAIKKGVETPEWKEYLEGQAMTVEKSYMNREEFTKFLEEMEYHPEYIEKARELLS